MYVDISLAHKTSLYVDIEFQTIQDTGVYGHKHQTYLYVDIKLSILLIRRLKILMYVDIRKSQVPM